MTMQLSLSMLLVHCIQHVHSVGTGRLVCDKRKSVQMESVLTILITRWN